MRRALALLILLFLIATPALAAEHPLRDAIARRMAEKGRDNVPANVRVLRDIAYGDDAAQTFDVYMPKDGTAGAPVLFMVHGGGWTRGDKTMDKTVINKVAYFAPRGWIVISTNYRLMPAANPLQQAQDVGRAAAFAQIHAKDWGGDRNRFVLMGHSAGAHLVSLVSARPDFVTTAGGNAWLATVALDSGGYQIDAIMRMPHLKLYDEAFGTDPVLWQQSSPALQMTGKMPPFLAVCSTLRDDSCFQAKAMQHRAAPYGTTFEVLPEPLKHADINDELGLDNDYTRAVADFLARTAGL